jgi:hypothetical protein
MHEKRFGLCKHARNISIQLPILRLTFFSGVSLLFAYCIHTYGWNRTALLYPLTPFFVVFCNVVATSNVHDLRLLNEVTATISKVKEQCAFGMNLYIMLSELIAMCTQLHDVQPAPSQLPLHGDSLVEASPQAERTAEPASHTSLMPDGQPVSSSSHPISPMPVLDQSTTASAILGQQPFSSTTAEAESGHASIWEEDLMSELFNIQPSVQWFDTDYYNLFGIQ